MKKTKRETVRYSLEKAYAALKRGDKMEARRWAAKAAALESKNEKAWLLLGMTGSKSANLAYFAEALALNPHSTFAKKGIRRLVAEGGGGGTISIEKARSYIKKARAVQKKKARRKSIMAATAFLSVFIAGVLSLSAFGGAISSVGGDANRPGQSDELAMLPSATPTLNFPLQAAQTQEAYTPIPSYTPLPTDTPTATPTATPEPTLTAYEIYMPIEIDADEYWADVDLTHQTLTAYLGDEPVRTFIVSTGTWQYPTVTGQYQIYVKYEAAPMSGPGYYLPGVPYVMYFYRGYGLHGTYWHDNFGTPMSHGCVNLTIDDAGWLYGVLEVGSWVNVHY
ncbi:MAG: L,D-transpeptidase [Anaerolineae bacterium]|nr:L,D-transpeptidase [Anaerolineae bacterium]